jgi:hypothetical protein
VESREANALKLCVVGESHDDVGAVEEVGNLHDLVASDGDLHGTVVQRPRTHEDEKLRVLTVAVDPALNIGGRVRLNVHVEVVRERDDRGRGRGDKAGRNHFRPLRPCPSIRASTITENRAATHRSGKTTGHGWRGMRNIATMAPTKLTTVIRAQMN